LAEPLGVCEGDEAPLAKLSALLCALDDRNMPLNRWLRLSTGEAGVEPLLCLGQD